LEVESDSTVGDTADPFKKVKTMIRSMLRKLEGQQSDDVKKAEWCDSELSKSTESKEKNAREVKKLKDRIQEMKVDLKSTERDYNDTVSELKELTNATQVASKLRASEKAKAKVALAQYSSAKIVVQGAIKVLKKVYAEKAQAAREQGSTYRASDMGSGVIGILEVAEADYGKMGDQTKLSESTSQQDYDDFMRESKVQKAVYDKELDYQKSSKVKIKSAIMRASTDLKGYSKELAAVTSYLKQLEASCTIKGDSYEERQSRRKNTLKSLKEAMTYLVSR